MFRPEPESGFGWIALAVAPMAKADVAIWVNFVHILALLQFRRAKKYKRAKKI